MRQDFDVRILIRSRIASSVHGEAIPMKRFLIIVSVIAAGPVSAANFCVPSGDVGALGTALVNAQSNGEDDLIQIESGTYDLDANLILASFEPHAVTIQGGYENFFGPCGSAPQTPDASRTVLDGASTYRFAVQSLGGALTVQGLSVNGMLAPAGQAFPSVMLQSTDVTIANARFSENFALSFHGVGIYGNGAVHVQNVLFDSNASPSGHAAVRIENTLSGALLCNWVINSTVVNNLSSVAALSLVNADPTCPSVVANSVFWGNGANDLHVATETFLVTNDLRNVQIEVGPVHPDTGSVVADPLFRDSGSGDYSLRDDSPLRDRGSGGSVFWSPGDWDVIGNSRTYNGTPDMGAFEVQDVIFAHGFDWQLQ